MTAPAAAAAATANEGGGDRRSREARRMVDDLLAIHPRWRRDLIDGMPEVDLVHVCAAASIAYGTPYYLWHDDTIGFTTRILQMDPWSLPRAMLAATDTAKEVVAPSCMGVGKTLSAAAKVCHHVSCNPPGTALAVTTATRFRQVQRQLWPEIRELAASARLPGRRDTTQWKLDTPSGIEYAAAYGFTAPVGQEAAVQGIHAPGKLLWVVDEAGGIARTIGRALRGTLTADSRALYIGNPPTDDDASWFEDVALSNNTTTITIPITETPNFTGELTAMCRLHPMLAPHNINTHLPTREDADRSIEDYGEDSPWWQAKGLARFPKGGSARVLPSMWVDDAAAAAGDLDPHAVIGLVTAGYLSSELARCQPRPGAWIRLGVDVAADGGDELAIARAEGRSDRTIVRLRRTRAGAENANAVDVAGVVLEEIREAEKLRRRLGTTARIRVKVDVIGVGWAVVSLLERWGTEGLHDADIVWVDVRESVEKERRKDGETLRPSLKRDEMWLAMRSLLQPQRVTELDTDPVQAVILDVDDRTRKQFVGPTYTTTTSSGLTVVESKKSMKARGLPSPDRAEACLLAVYEPFPLEQTKKRKRIRAGA